MIAAADRPLATEADREQLAVDLVRRSAVLSRLVLTRSQVTLHRSDAGLLSRLQSGPQRITALCEQEALAQPTVTLSVKRLEADGLVRRAQDPSDGRAVLVSLTDAGRGALGEVRAAYTRLLSRHLAALTESQQQALVAGTAVLAELIENIEQDHQKES